MAKTKGRSVKVITGKTSDLPAEMKPELQVGLLHVLYVHALYVHVLYVHVLMSGSGVIHDLRNASVSVRKFVVPFVCQGRADWLYCACA